MLEYQMLGTKRLVGRAYDGASEDAAAADQSVQ